MKLFVVLTMLAALLVLTPGARAAGEAATQPAAQAMPTLWIVGDSTVRNGTRGQRGWGSDIDKFFDTARIRVENRAIGGRSSRTFQTEGRWDEILSQAKPGDFVLIQMGHNDASALSGDNRERGTIRGIGEESKEVTLTLKEGKTEVVHTYGWYMRKYVRDAKQKGMTPIICSPVPRCPGAATTMPANPAPEGYRLWAQQVAEQEQAPFIDLYGLIWQKYVTMKPEEIKAQLFTEADNTHTNAAGAAFNAERVVEGLRSLKNVPLASYLK